MFEFVWKSNISYPITLTAFGIKLKLNYFVFIVQATTGQINWTTEKIVTEIIFKTYNANFLYIVVNTFSPKVNPRILC